MTRLPADGWPTRDGFAAWFWRGRTRAEPARPARAGEAVRSVKHRGRRPLIVKAILATLIEGASVYWWLRFYEDEKPWLAFAVLAAGEIIETAFLAPGIRKAASERWGELAPGEETHFKRVARRIWVTGTLEVGVWALWLASFNLLDGVARPYQVLGAGLVLLVLMHLKHQVEHVAVCDTPFRTGLFSRSAIFASAAEVVGAVVCLALLVDEHFVLAFAALFAGLLIEHIAQLAVLGREIHARDVRRPRDPRWKPTLSRAVRLYVLTHFAPFWKFVERIPPLARWVNRYAINRRDLRHRSAAQPVEHDGPVHVLVFAHRSHATAGATCRRRPRAANRCPTSRRSRSCSGARTA